MHVRSARDLPDFRLWLIEQWRPDGMFTRAETILRSAGYMPDAGDLPPGTVEGHVQRRSLPQAALWWVATEMVSLVARASDTLPETTLTEELLPDDDGLVVFEAPLVGTMSDTGEAINTDAMVWTRGNLRPDVHPGMPACITIASYKFTAKGEELGNEISGRVVSEVDMWNPTGTATWIFGEDTERIEGKEYRSAEQQISTSEDRRWLAAMWLLAAQPLAQTTIQQAGRHAAKRSARAKVGSDVRLVNVRRRQAAKPKGDGEGREVEHDHRWIVGGETGGFWRQQACGPGWSQHRPVWIDPYIAGPDDKPLRVRETVKVLKGDS